ncbi:MAG: hypothetical protein KAW12_19755 [Candidatus Aminicenantes bacterium]|nr:hypothetical protein [Candidatus Aminicenantes bacterium]
MKKRKRDSIIERAISYLITSSDEKLSRLTVRDVSGELKISFLLPAVIFLLSRRETFACFAARQKLFRAAQHLEKNKDMNIAALSKRLGFATQEEFTERFDNFFLVKPERYWELSQIKERYSWEN